MPTIRTEHPLNFPEPTLARVFKFSTAADPISASPSLHAFCSVADGDNADVAGAISAKGDRAVIEAKSAVVKVIVQLIRSLLQGIAELDRKIEEAAAEHPDFFIFESLPGAGAVMAPLAVGCLWFTTRSLPLRRRTADLQWDRAGDGAERETKWVHFRWACPKFLRQSFHE